MYEEISACFDPSNMQEGLAAEDGFSQTHSFSMEELSHQYHHHHQNHPPEEAAAASAAAMEIELQRQLGLDMEQCYNHPTSNNLMEAHLMQEMGQNPNQVFQYDHSNWDPNSVNPEMQEMSFTHDVEMQNGIQQSFNSSSIPDLLNLFQLPRCSASSVLPNASVLPFLNPNHNKSSNFSPTLSFLGDLGSSEHTASASNGVYDPLFHLNLPPQPPYFRELFQSLPHGYNLPSSRSGSLFGGVDEREASGGSGLYQDGEGRHFDGGNGVFEFTTREWDMSGIPKESNGKGTTKHFATEKQRRQHLNGKYDDLKKLVPNNTKNDRASVVGDAIEYIRELLRTMNELKILVEKKRNGRERIKRHKTEDGAPNGELDTSKVKADPDQSYNGPSLRSSWLQRKSKDTEVDVRIIDDEVTIKLAQRKKINCLLSVSKVLDELQLDIQHVAGGLVGDNYSFLFNSKICEGSSVYASAIANKLIDVVNRQYAAILPTSSY